MKVLGKTTPSKEIYVYSYPKSGRTWLRLILDTLNEKEVPIAYVHGDAVPKKGRHFKDMTFNSKLKDRKVIFLLRDPRDTVVSAYYDALHRDKIFDKGVTQFIRHPRFGIEKVLRFHQICYENQPLVDQSILITYEALKADTIGEMLKILRLLDWQVSDQKLREAIAVSSFQNMRKMEETGDIKQTYAYALSPGNPQNPNSFKVRKGHVEGYKEELSGQDIKFCNNMMKVKPNPFYQL